ncbi:hypothetical protein ACH40D_29890 [Streptomyces olivaceoviridis]|uniref:N-acetyltransferase domain-containing protein n=1 Tax=Streptomyces olivaceoviridis TaxID=1921 RepID=A0ABW7VBS1_STROI|nr:hypothetical protein [Streptomyces corchorusii]
MTEGHGHTWQWGVAEPGDAPEVHALLGACDTYQAEQSGTPVPLRRPERTRELVASAAVHVLRSADGIAAMFTLAWDDSTPDGYPPAARPARLSRLAVRPELLSTGSMAGVQCVRRAIELATARGADVLRAEANPDLAQTRALLGHLGFQQHGPVESDGDRRWVRLQRQL